jgi:hypothetical protein
MLGLTEKATKFRQDCMRMFLDFYVLLPSIIFLIAVFLAVVYIGT